jgi:hypothetical protein
LFSGIPGIKQNKKQKRDRRNTIPLGFGGVSRPL